MAAFVSDAITADMVEATEFHELSNRYQVYGVPKTIINEIKSMEGAAPEKKFLETILQATGAM